MNKNLSIASVQISDGVHLIPTATLIFSTPAGEEKISVASQPGENIFDAIFKAVKQTASHYFSGIKEKEIKLLASGGTSSRKGCHAHAHIYAGANGNGQKIKRHAWHGNNLNLAIARALLNCFRSLAE